MESRTVKRALFVVLAAVPAGCADWPDLEIESEPSGYADLVPFDDLLGKARITDEDRETAAEIEEDLLDRAEGLRRRAEILDQPVEDREALADMARRLDALADEISEDPAE